MKLPLLKDAQVSGKKVFLRSDLDVPLSEQSTRSTSSGQASHNQQVKILDDTRLRYGLPTIEYLLNNGATITIAGHLGRPHGVDKSFSLEPVATWLSENINYSNDTYHHSATTIGGFPGWELSANLFLLENLRFYGGEEENDPEFAKRLANLADIYVNDGFTVIHRNHASVVGVAKLLPHLAGFRLQKEVEVLSGILENPKRPLVVIIGGAKMETKLPVISNMARIADFVLVGGKVAQETDVLSRNVIVAALTSDGFDITEESVTKFKEVIDTAKTIVWNGPLGLMKHDSIDSEKGTREIAKAVSESSAYKIVGGGDTLGYLQQLGVIEKFDFVSTGGGAMLAFLAGEKLPGFEVLRL